MQHENAMLTTVHAGLGLPETEIKVTGRGLLPSRYCVTDLAVASVAAVGSAVVALLSGAGLGPADALITVDRRLASHWFRCAIQPIDWTMPPVWDAIAGDYPTRDGFIKLHTNLQHHRAAALSVLACKADRAAVAAAVAAWEGDALEQAIVANGGVAAAMRSSAAWRAHPQGVAIGQEPLAAWSGARSPTGLVAWRPRRARPLAGLRVLDCTRVLAGPVASRMLAGLGAEVLRIDPPGWDEPNVVPDITLGKRCATLDLKSAEGRETFERLLGDADILLHGYRPGALDGLGFGAKVRERIAPALIDVSLDAYGWTGPWQGRRGFDSLVQMSCGIAEAGMQWANSDVPTPLPVQALDHATGYLMATAAIKAVGDFGNPGQSRSARFSLARTAELLMAFPQLSGDESPSAITPDDCSSQIERTPWGDAHRLRPPLLLEGTEIRWDLPAAALGSSEPEFAS